MVGARTIITAATSPFVFDVSLKLGLAQNAQETCRTASMSEPLQRLVFLKDLRQPFFLKELPASLADEPPIDLRHLARMSLGRRHLECEVLELFDRQVEMLLRCVQEAGPVRVASVAQMLAGSARGIGAWRVAAAAEALERAVMENRKLASTFQMLECAVVDARLAICAMLRVHYGADHT
jgi:hypothetical protein